MPSLRLQIFGSRMPVYVKCFRNRIGRLAGCRSSSDLMAQFGGDLRPTDLDALCLGSRHASFGPFADFLRLDFSERRQEGEQDVANQFVVS
jgi:hypothetical protein